MSQNNVLRQLSTRMRKIDRADRRIVSNFVPLINFKNNKLFYLLMRKLLLLTLLMCSLGLYAQHQANDYIYTPNGRFKLTENNLFNSQASVFSLDDGFGGWTPLTGSADYTEYALVEDGMLTWTNALATNGIVGTATIEPGYTYIVTFNMYNDDAPFTSAVGEGVKSRIQIVANSTPDEFISTIEGEKSEVSSDVVLIGTANSDYAVSVKVENALNNQLHIVFAGLPANTHITNVEIWKAIQVYDVRLLNKVISYAETLINDENFSANTVALATFKSECYDAVTDMLANMPELFDNESAGEDAATMLNEGIEEYLEASAPSLANLIQTKNGSSTYTGFDFASWPDMGRNNLTATGPNVYVQGGSWGHLPGDAAISLRIQQGYNLSGAFNVYHPLFTAGKYFFTAEIRNAGNPTKNNWPGTPSYDLVTTCQYFINGNINDVEVGGQEWTRIYLVSDVPENEYLHAGIFWPGAGGDDVMEYVPGQNFVNIGAVGTSGGGIFEVRNVEVRGFDGAQLIADIERASYFTPFKAQYDAIVNARNDVLALQADKATYPYNQDTLQIALDKWDPYYEKMINSGWVGSEGEDTKVATVEQLTNFVKFQGVWETPEDTIGVEGYMDYPVSRGYLNAANYVKASVAHFTTVASTITLAKTVRDDDLNSNGDKATLNGVIESTQSFMDATYAAASDASYENDVLDMTSVNDVLLEAIEAFKQSAALSNFAEFFFDNGYTTLYDTEGEADPETGLQPVIGYEVPATTGDFKMTFASATAFNPDNTAGETTYMLGTNGANDQILRVGSSEATIDFSGAGITADECLRLEFDCWTGNLNTGFFGAGVKNAEGDRLGGFWLNRYRGIIDSRGAGWYNDFATYEPTYDVNGAVNGYNMVSGSMNINDMYGQGKANEVLLANNAYNHFVLVYDAKAQTIIGEIYVGGSTTPKAPGIANGQALTMPNNENEDFIPAKFYLNSNYTNKDRRCWIDNITMIKYKSNAEVTGINEVVTKNKAAGNGTIYNIAGQAVSENFKGILIKNGKKYIK